MTNESITGGDSNPFFRPLAELKDSDKQDHIIGPIQFPLSTHHQSGKFTFLPLL